MKTSFVSEHSLEYLIVPKIMGLLKDVYWRVVPIYYWSTREGNALSSSIHNNMTLQLLSVFPRRPKLKSKESKLISVKINDSIIEYAEIANSFGIPTIYCFPVITSLFDIEERSNIVTLSVTKYEPADIYFNINKETLKIRVENNQKHRIKILSDDSVIDYALKGREYSWQEAVKKMNELRNSCRGSEYRNIPIWYGTSLYKPIYFLMIKKYKQYF